MVSKKKHTHHSAAGGKPHKHKIKHSGARVKHSGTSNIAETSDSTQKAPKTTGFESERDIAMDFATKVYKEFDTMIKSIVLFGSSAKKASTPDSDIDIIVLIDDVSIMWDQELIAYYRETLANVIQNNPYQKALHINTVKLSTWWADLIRGDPVVINILRYGDTLIDHGGFFEPIKLLLKNGAIKSTPEAIYTLLQRAPNHIARARASMLAVVDGLYWAMVDSAHAALIAAKVSPPSPEHIPEILNEHFVNTKVLRGRYVDYYSQIHAVAKEIVYGKKVLITGVELDDFKKKVDEFVSEMVRIVDGFIKAEKI